MSGHLREMRHRLRPQRSDHQDREKALNCISSVPPVGLELLEQGCRMARNGVCLVFSVLVDTPKCP